MNAVEMFTKLRGICDEVLEAHKIEDMEMLENAMGKFIMLMIKFETTKSGG